MPRVHAGSSSMHLENAVLEGLEKILSFGCSACDSRMLTLPECTGQLMMQAGLPQCMWNWPRLLEMYGWGCTSDDMLPSLLLPSGHAFGWVKQSSEKKANLLESPRLRPDVPNAREKPASDELSSPLSRLGHRPPLHQMPWRADSSFRAGCWLQAGLRQIEARADLSIYLSVGRCI